MDAQRHRLLAGIFGALAALATFHGWINLADVGLLGLAGYLWLTRRRNCFPTCPEDHGLPSWVLVLALPIAVSAIWATVWWSPLWTAARIICLAIAALELRNQRRMIAYGFVAALLLQTVGLLATIHYQRPAGFTENASVLGQVGLTALFAMQTGPVGILGAFTAVVTLGVAVSRTALISAAAFIVLNPTRLRLLAGGVLVVVAVAYLTVSGGWGRLGGWLPDIENRIGLTGAGDSRARAEFVAHHVAQGMTPAEVDERYPETAPKFSVLGYGYDSFVAATGRVRPHTIPVLMVYELGILALPIFGVIAWALAERKLSWRLVIPIGILWLATDEQWSTGAGMWMLAVILTTYTIFQPLKMATQMNTTTTMPTIKTPMLIRSPDPAATVDPRHPE